MPADQPPAADQPPDLSAVSGEVRPVLAQESA
jgi:hypothetical protein